MNDVLWLKFIIDSYSYLIQKEKIVFSFLLFSNFKNKHKQKNTNIKQTAKAFEDFDKDPNAKVAILCGEDGTFCAGFDLKALATLKTGI